jgi:hypothetical protein
MTDKMKLAQLLDQFVDDLNTGVMPRIYELMASEPDAVAEMVPLLDFVAWFKASTTQVPVSEKEEIRHKSAKDVL